MSDRLTEAEQLISRYEGARDAHVRAFQGLALARKDLDAAERVLADRLADGALALNGRLYRQGECGDRVTVEVIPYTAVPPCPCGQCTDEADAAEALARASREPASLYVIREKSASPRVPWLYAYTIEPSWLPTTLASSAKRLTLVEARDWVTAQSPYSGPYEIVPLATALKEAAQPVAADMPTDPTPSPPIGLFVLRWWFAPGRSWRYVSRPSNPYGGDVIHHAITLASVGAAAAWRARNPLFHQYEIAALAECDGSPPEPDDAESQLAVNGEPVLSRLVEQRSEC